MHCFKKLFSLLIIMGITPISAQAFFCPTNFSQIDFGYTIDQVTQTCGTPDKQETKEVKSQGPQEWNYYVKQPLFPSTTFLSPGSLKMQIAFDAEGKCINMSVNGVGVGSTAICGPMIQLGDDQSKVKSACGKPAYINQQNTGDSQASSKVTTFTYNSNPPVTLIFENGLLTTKQ